VTLPEVVTSDLAGKFGEISLYNQHADFKLGSDSNSNSTSPWAIASEPAIEPSCADSQLHEHFHTAFALLARPTRRLSPHAGLGKRSPLSTTRTPTPSPATIRNSSYEFDFGADPDESGSKTYTMEQPLSGPASGLVITSTPIGRFVYWPDRKPADLTDKNSRCVAYLYSLPFQEGTPLAPTEEHTPTEVATSDTSLGSPDRQVFMTTNETTRPSGHISADKLSVNAPADETDATMEARRERNRKRNVAEALDQVESRVHTTPEKCLMSITTIARLAQGMRAGEVIAKLTEDAYFMRVDNRVTQVPPVRNRQQDNEATSRSADIGRNCTRGELPANPNRTRASVGRPSHGGNSTGGAGGNHEIVPHRDPGGGGSDGGSSNHGAGRRPGGGGDRGS
jgi:hypothetical protein